MGYVEFYVESWDMLNSFLSAVLDTFCLFSSIYYPNLLPEDFCMAEIIKSELGL